MESLRLVVKGESITLVPGFFFFFFFFVVMAVAETNRNMQKASRMIRLFLNLKAEQYIPREAGINLVNSRWEQRPSLCAVSWFSGDTG